MDNTDAKTQQTDSFRGFSFNNVAAASIHDADRITLKSIINYEIDFKI